MSKKLVQFAVSVSLSCIPACVYAQENPVDVSGCELAKNPKSFDGKLIRVRGALNVYFEDFSLEVAKCGSQQGIWLAFGGDVPGIVPSTVNDTFRKPGSDIKVKGVSYGIKKDEDFRKLYALIASRHRDKRDYRVTALLAGVFFAGEESKTANGSINFVGYGHLGCCALLVITQVSAVESVPPANLGVHGVVFGPDSKPIDGFTVIDDVIGGSPPERQTTSSDNHGRFSFSNSGQQLRFESPKYRPIALTVEPGGAAVRVALEDAKVSDWIIPACTKDSSGGRIGFSVLFAIPPTMKSSPFNSNDTRSFFVYQKGGEPESAQLIISHSPDEMKDAADSLDSKWIRERWIKDSAGNVIGIDARGRMNHGGYWRTALFSGHDTASYSLQSGRKPTTLDQVIDSTCLAGNLSH